MWDIRSEPRLWPLKLPYISQATTGLLTCNFHPLFRNNFFSQSLFIGVDLGYLNTTFGSYTAFMHSTTKRLMGISEVYMGFQAHI